MGQLESFGGSSRDVEEVALKHVGALIHEVQPDAIVTRFVLIVETIDDDDKCLSAFPSPGLKQWESMGFLEYALQRERMNDVDDEDEP